jgi:Coenzyme PQQ synthesis protein D (PqqD)
MTPTAIYTRHPDYVQRDVAGECILVPIRRKLTEANSIYVLNETGAAIWNRIDGQRTAQDIVTDFCNEYDVATDQLTKDFTSLLDDLLSIQAVEEVTR